MGTSFGSDMHDFVLVGEGENFDVDAFIAASGITPVRVWHCDERIPYHKLLATYGTNGFEVGLGEEQIAPVLSDAAAVAFLREHYKALRQLREQQVLTSLTLRMRCRMGYGCLGFSATLTHKLHWYVASLGATFDLYIERDEPGYEPHPGDDPARKPHARPTLVQTGLMVYESGDWLRDLDLMDAVYMRLERALRKAFRDMPEVEPTGSVSFDPLDPFEDNFGHCVCCGGWTTDVERPDPHRVLSYGRTVDGRLICDQCGDDRPLQEERGRKAEEPSE